MGDNPGMRVAARDALLAGAACLAAIAVSGCGGRPAAWVLPNGDLAGKRAAQSAIDAANVARLRVRWRFSFPMRPSDAGDFASTPLVDGTTVYLQDLNSDVFALDRASGAVRWSTRFDAPNGGPNGLALGSGRVYGATDSDAFALSAATGARLWQRHLTSQSAQFVDVAPLPWHDLVFLSTVGYAPFGRGALYALDARTGAVRWRFVTIAHPWPHPLAAGGGGAWYPVSVDTAGRLYAGIANPGPWGGTPALPNGGAFPGPALYTDSLVVLDAETGRLLWFDQVTPHDIRDHDFEATPIVATVAGRELVIGGGKDGRVIAWDRQTRRRVWSALVGVHRNDTGPLPAHRVVVCPGLFGGVETPMAYAAGRLYVAGVDLCGWGSAVGHQALTSVDPARGTGRVVAIDAATGRILWDTRLPLPDFGCATVSNDVVFTSTYGGELLALATSDGRILWRARLPAGVNACPAIAGDLLLVGAGIPLHRGSRPQLLAFGVS
jgi:alcohol dehydrogenase (cytochrome c)